MHTILPSWKLLYMEMQSINIASLFRQDGETHVSAASNFVAFYRKGASQRYRIQPILV